LKHCRKCWKSAQNYTVLGDDVNIASRCESLNKRYDTEIMITESTYNSLKGKFLCRWLAFVSLKGKSLPIHVYEAICSEEVATEEQHKFCKLHNNLKQEIIDGNREEARSICHELLDMNENNIAAKEVLDVLEERVDQDLTLNLVLVCLHTK
jgi:hypothetical protein